MVAQNVAVNIAANATVSTGATSLIGTTVSISTNFVTGQDVLGINGSTSGTDTYGDGNIAWSYNSTSGILTLTGASTAANYQATIRKTTYKNSSATPTTATRSISFCLNGAVPFTGNNHFFEYVTNLAITWADANTTASASRLFGLKGYLATITSDAENTFCASKIGAAGAWLGGNAAAGDGSVWKWVTGPAAEQYQFWSGVPGSAYNSRYANWNEGEPNSGLHGEDYVQFFPGSGGKWNNLNGASNETYISGYIVEYGGMADDPVIQITDNVNVTITQGITATGDPFSAFATCTGTASNAQSFTVSGSYLTANIIVTTPTGYALSTTAGGTYTGTLNLSPTSGVISATTIYVRLTGASAGSPGGNISMASTEQTTKNIAVTGTVTAASVGGITKW